MLKLIVEIGMFGVDPQVVTAEALYVCMFYVCMVSVLWG